MKSVLALRGWVAVAILVVFSAVAFSPGAVMAAEQAVAAVSIADQHAPILTVMETTRHVAPRSTKAGTAQQLDMGIRSTARDGYMNWRMRETTRSV